MRPRGHNQPGMAISADLEIKSDSLTGRLRARIEHEGPISFRDWMAAALYDERDGYYCRSDRVRQGRSGDYRTAPESSPLFAGTFARYFSRLFAELGSPSSWTIFEAGASSGAFAHGVLTALQAHHSRVFAATNYVIDEVSPDARLQAAARLSDFADRVRFERLPEVPLPVGPGIVFSNELIDAFPVQRVECDPDQPVRDYCQRAGLHLAEGQIAEVNLEAQHFLSRAASLLERGFVITVDYGDERDNLLSAPHRYNGTLRAFRDHRLISNVLAAPGEQDLTTTIDWTQICEAGAVAGLKTLRYERLDQFFLKEGLLDELEMRAGLLSGPEALRLRTSAREMIMPHGLTASFQILVQTKHP